MRLSGVTLIALLCLSGVNVMAADAPQLDYRTTGTLSGTLKDGFLVGKGRVMYHGEHAGFRVWSEAPRNGNHPARYLLEGQQNVRNKLRVRIESERGQPDGKEGKGIIVLTGDDSILFKVVVDGQQNVRADNYPIELRALVLLP
ncbi:hypothetical protein JHW33_07555 [Rahnella aceris]|jgi:hypothetical protein|uniref:AfaD family invasin n=1 Tax=Rahnella sp. (strain Y9602) TaxID=2703885 RepID=UPI0019037BFB|nr:AfaD family invasin [Rahnella aceris]QQN36467.1 hypothetical protein JHW33_07555 [Rahnella aceris]